jgi:UDP-N-acetylglucosamine:LPS N-acetylglucosamine transferase
MEILHALDHTHHHIQFALVAGGNDQLHKAFKGGDWRHPVKIYNFVEVMPKLMRAADIILCKAGGLITTESLASELPIMVVNFLPGQEEGNVAYIVDHDAGELCDTPEKAVETLNRWLEDKGSRLIAISENAAQASQAGAAKKISEEAWRLLQKNNSTSKT